MSRHRPAERSAGSELLLVGDTLFSCDAEGRWYTLTALSKQLEVWFEEFDRVTIAAHVRPGPPPADHRCLDHQNIDFLPLRRAGGSGLRAKLEVVAALLSWVWVLAPRIRHATAVHLRAPCNVTFAAIPLARLLQKNRYAIYADNWEPRGVEPMTYRAQRCLLQRFGGVVHAYVPPDGSLPAHVRANISPSFTDAEIDSLGPAVADRIDRLRSDPVSGRPLRICVVGSFTTRKNQSAIIRAGALLRAREVPFMMRFAGDGPALAQNQALATELGIADHIEFLGHIGGDALWALFEWADVNALVSFAEGYGKVFLEGMAYGCPAVCGPGAMQASIVGHDERGRQVSRAAPEDVAEALIELRALPLGRQIDLVTACRDYVRRFTTDAFARSILQIVRDEWQVPRPRNPGGGPADGWTID